MATLEKSFFARELQSLANTLENACNSLATLKQLHDLELQNAAQLRKGKPGSPDVKLQAPERKPVMEVLDLPHHIKEHAESPDLEKGGSGDRPDQHNTEVPNKMKKYLPNLSKATPEICHDSQILCVVPFAQLGYAASEGWPSSHALVLSKSSIASKDARHVTIAEIDEAKDHSDEVVMQTAEERYAHLDSEHEDTTLFAAGSTTLKLPDQQPKQVTLQPVPSMISSHLSEAEPSQMRSETPNFDARLLEFWADTKAHEEYTQSRSNCTVHVVHAGVPHCSAIKHWQTKTLTERAENSCARLGQLAKSCGQMCYDGCFCILNPVGVPRMTWNGICLFWICYDIIVVPMSAFDIEESSGLQAVEWILTIWWTLDIYMSFRTGLIVSTRVEMRPHKIAKNYACTWLPIDVAIVVVEWVNRFFQAFATVTFLRTQRVLRLFRLVKLVRVVKLSGFSKQMQEQVTSNIILLILTLLLLTGILLATIHIVACIWYAIGTSSEDDGWTSVEQYDGEKTGVFWYFASIRWVISQVNGRTDLDERRNMKERLFTCLCGVGLALLAQAVFISLITKALFDLSEVVSEKIRRKRLVNEYLDHNPVNPFLTLQVKRCVNEYQDVDKEIMRETQIMALLPGHLRVEILECVRSPILMQHPLFHALPFESFFVMRMICVDVVQAVSGLKDEVVFDKDQPCECIIFMNKLCGTYGTPSAGCSRLNASRGARASVVTPVRSVSGKRQSTSKDVMPTSISWEDNVTPVKEGSWIAEAALWVEWRHQGRLVSSGHGILLYVPASKFATGLKKQHPDAYSLACTHGMEVARELREMHPCELSDILPFEIQLYSPLSVMVTVVSASGLRNADGMFTGKSDPYCVCKVTGMAGKGGEVRFTTKTIHDNLDPIWEHHAEVKLSRHQLLEFAIYDYDFGKQDQELGVAFLFPEEFTNEDGFEGNIELRTSDGGPAPGTITVRIQSIQSIDAAKAQKATMGSWMTRSFSKVNN